MIIKSITLQNFRQYKNENTIEFSTDPNKNVTLVLGVNTSGKTTIVQAFNWCLYETTNFKSRDMLLNSEVASSLPENGYATVRVQIVLEHEDKEYTIVRAQRFSRVPQSNRVRGERTLYLFLSKNLMATVFPFWHMNARIPLIRFSPRVCRIISFLMEKEYKILTIKKTLCRRFVA